MQEIHKGIEQAVEAILGDYQTDRAIDKMDVLRRPDRDAIIALAGAPKRELLDKHYLRKHGSNAYYGQGEN